MARSPEEVKRARRSALLFVRYGVTADEWDEVLARQGGTCAMCPAKPSPTGRSLHSDHDHKTGLFRGILCWRCNNILRRGTTATLLRAGADYLDDPPAVRFLGQRFGTKGPVVKRRRRRRRK